MAFRQFIMGNELEIEPPPMRHIHLLMIKPRNYALQAPMTQRASFLPPNNAPLLYIFHCASIKVLPIL